MTLLTTGTIAKMCSVSVGTVHKWIDSGLLKGFRVPGSKDRRVTRESLEEFAKEYNLPLKELNGHNTPIRK